MKLVFMVAAAAAYRPIRSLAQTMGVPEEELQDGNHWRKEWPYGIDDGSDDDLVLPQEGKRRGLVHKQAEP